jgi:cytochrome c553
MGRKLLIGVLLLVGALIVLALISKREPPGMPADADHVRTVGNEAACLECHGPAGKRPRGPKHPLANDCGRCHALKGGR